MGGALGIALLPGGGADGVQRFLLQQRFVSVKGVQTLEPALQVVDELVGGELHGRSLNACVRHYTDRGFRKA